MVLRSWKRAPFSKFKVTLNFIKTRQMTWNTYRTKNTVNILLKNLMDCFIGGISYWAIGWGLAYGDGGNPFCGGSAFFNWKLDYDEYPKWFFQVKQFNGYHYDKYPWKMQLQLKRFNYLISTSTVRIRGDCSNHRVRCSGGEMPVLCLLYLLHPHYGLGEW